MSGSNSSSIFTTVAATCRSAQYVTRRQFDAHGTTCSCWGSIKAGAACTCSFACGHDCLFQHRVLFTTSAQSCVVLLLCRQKQKNLLEGVVSQRESLQQRLYQAEVQVGAKHRRHLAIQRLSCSMCQLHTPTAASAYAHYSASIAMLACDVHLLTSLLCLVLCCSWSHA